jgi:hypothetical protein
VAHLLSKHVADVSQQCHVAIACQLQAVGKGDADAGSQGGDEREDRKALKEETPRSRSVMLLSPGIVECLEDILDVAFGY